MLRVLAAAPWEATPERQSHSDRKLALTHNLGGYPGEMVSFVSVVGSALG